MLTLFVVSSLEGWPDIMYDAVDTTDVDQSPRKNNNIWAAYYFIFFIFMGSFFFLNLFIAVVFDNFN
jgi:cation transport ATPase